MLALCQFYPWSISWFNSRLIHKSVRSFDPATKNKIMGHSSCCVVNCKNTGRNSKCKFYRFPTAPWKLEQRNKWIVAIKRKKMPKESSTTRVREFRARQRQELGQRPRGGYRQNAGRPRGNRTAADRLRDYRQRQREDRERANDVNRPSTENVIDDANIPTVDGSEHHDPLEIELYEDYHSHEGARKIFKKFMENPSGYACSICDRLWFKTDLSPASIDFQDLINNILPGVDIACTDGSPWVPKPRDLICSEHFVGGKKSEEEASPSYIPTIFPSRYGSKKIDEATALKRHRRFMERRRMKETVAVTNLNIQEASEIIVDNDSLKTDQECQVNIFSRVGDVGKTFICNRYVFNEICHAEIQTEIQESSRIVQKFQHKECGTDQETSTKSYSFSGISSAHNDKQLIDLTGVTFSNFRLLLERMTTNHKHLVSREDALFIFLMKMKTGLTFPALGIMFGVPRTIISSIFFSTLENLASTSADLVFCPNKYTVQATMPDCFHPDYSDTRLIIDCIELTIEVPEIVDNRDFYYSHYKKNFTGKVLIGVTPGGFISFKSKATGGRQSDFPVESGLIDLLEEGNIVLADKGFQDFKSAMDAKGKEVKIAMPPFLQNKKEKTEKPYNIARVGIHVERIMQRLRLFQILNKIPENLFHCVDDIVHICCVLVNLQHPIFLS